MPSKRQAAARSAMAQVAKQVMQEAKGQTGKASVLIARMEPEVGRQYSEDSISAWVRGQTVPPADALLAAAKVTGISVDEYLRSDEDALRIADRISKHSEDIEDLRDNVQRLSDVVQRLGEAMGTMSDLQETVSAMGEALRLLRRQLVEREERLRQP